MQWPNLWPELNVYNDRIRLILPECLKKPQKNNIIKKNVTLFYDCFIFVVSLLSLSLKKTNR